MKPSARRARSGRQKILVIEDDPVARADLQARLEANGYVVARAADAASPLTVVNREPPDLILLALGLPAGDGYLILERLRTIEPRAAGYEVRLAEHGREAWDTLQVARIPVVICDWYMPEMDGPELCRRIRARRDQPYVYFILITSRGGREQYLAGMRAGADDFLT